MQALARSEEIKSSQFILDFLYEVDVKNWAKIMKDANDIIKAPRTLQEYMTVNGQAKV